MQTKPDVEQMLMQSLKELVLVIPLEKITIKEIHESVVDIDAENYYEALAKVQTDYWENPNNYLLEPKDTFFE